MDDIVAQAMRKWPNVPDVYGWLSLDRRGNWLIQGERIGNAALRAFIARNYTCDAQGRWFFQNGPQRVFVTLPAAPFVYSLHRANDAVVATAHTGVAAQRIDAIMFAPGGIFVIATELGPGLVHDRDMGFVVDAARSDDNVPVREQDFTALRVGEQCPIRIDLGNAKRPLEIIAIEDLPARFHFDPAPALLA